MMMKLATIVRTMSPPYTSAMATGRGIRLMRRKTMGLTPYAMSVATMNTSTVLGISVRK